MQATIGILIIGMCNGLSLWIFWEMFLRCPNITIRTVYTWGGDTVTPERQRLPSNVALHIAVT
jgi:hypothetical protein